MYIAIILCSHYSSVPFQTFPSVVSSSELILVVLLHAYEKPLFLFSLFLDPQ